MKWSRILHAIAALTGIVGAASVVLWWVALARTEGLSFMFTPEHMYDDAQILFLASIAFGIGTLIHLWGEKKR